MSVDSHTRAVVGGESRREETEDPSVGAEQEHGFREFRHYVPQHLLDVSFPVSVRGYDRGAVDAYIERVSRVLAELKVRASPPAAVRHALEQAEEKVQALLRAAREAAEEITASAQREAEESTARAKDEAVKLVVNATAEAERVKAEAEELITTARADADETIAKAHAKADELLVNATATAEDTVARARAEADERLRRLKEELAALRQAAETKMHELHADTEKVWSRRSELLQDIRSLAGGLVDVAEAGVARFPRREAAPEEVTPAPEAEDETESPEIATDESGRARPAAGAEEGGDDSPSDAMAERSG